MALEVTEIGWTLTVGVQGLRYASKLFNLIDKKRSVTSSCNRWCEKVRGKNVWDSKASNVQVNVRKLVNIRIVM